MREIACSVSGMVSILKLVILCAAPLRLRYWVLRRSCVQLVKDELVRCCSELVCEQVTVRQDIGELTPDVILIGLLLPLDALQQFPGLNGNALDQVLSGVELPPLSFSHKCPKRGRRGLLTHPDTLPPRNSLELTDS